MSSLAVFSFGRTNSQRCPNKMLRPFGDSSLADLILSKLARLREETFFAGEGEEFRRKCVRHGVRFIERDPRSANIDEPIVEILSFLRQVDAEHLLLVNACLPFLRVETIARFLAGCREGGCAPAFSVLRRANYFLGLDRTALNFDPSAKTINTKTVKPVYEFVHGLYFFNRNYFFQHGTYWDWKTVRLIELPGGMELFDIDTQEEFDLAQGLWMARVTAGGAGRQSEAPAPAGSVSEGGK